MMKVLIIGGGLIGISTAYALNQLGFSVRVVERRPGPGLETSFANGALLHPSLPEPWNSPGCWRTLARSLVRKDSAMKLRLSAVPGLARWGLRFLSYANPGDFHRSTLSNFHLAQYSLTRMHELREVTGIEYGRITCGTLRIFRTQTALESALRTLTPLANRGLEYRVLNREDVLALEPALEPIGKNLAGGIHYYADEGGDAYQYCLSLARYAESHGVNIRYGATFSGFEMSSDRVVAAICNGERITADHYVVAAASYTAPLLRGVGVNVPVAPAKGYSITFDNTVPRTTLATPVIDDELHAAVVPLPNAVRVVGTAEFAGFDLTLSQERIQNLLNLLSAILPDAQFDFASARPWCGLRPMSADGVAIIGPTPLKNVSLNTGHGHLGWTTALGSAYLLADLLAGKSPELDPTHYDLTRFKHRAPPPQVPGQSPAPT